MFLWLSEVAHCSAGSKSEPRGFAACCFKLRLKAKEVSAEPASLEEKANRKDERFRLRPKKLSVHGLILWNGWGHPLRCETEQRFPSLPLKSQRGRAGTGRSTGDISSGTFPHSSALLWLPPRANGHRAAISTCHPPGMQDPSGCAPGEPAPSTSGQHFPIILAAGHWGRGVHAWLRTQGNLKAGVASP